MPETTPDDIASAIQKIGAERQKALHEARTIIRRNDRDELMFLIIHQNHLMRVTKLTNLGKLDSETKAMCGVAADAYAYALQLTYKYGGPQSGVQFTDYYRLCDLSRFVNNGFEMETMLKYLPFQRFGERSQLFKIYLEGMRADETRSRMFNYAARHELDCSLRHWMPVEDLINELFPPGMDPEFTLAFGLTTQEVKQFYSALIGEVAVKLQNAAQLMPKVTGDRIDATHFDSFRAARFAYTIEYEPFLNRFGPRKQSFRKFLLKQALRRDEIDDSELRHFAIWRRHILRLSRHHFTLSPEISATSPNFGIHYALLENQLTKDSYQAKRAVQFQERIESVLKALGLRTIAKNLDAKLGKRDLGDVDILAEDSTSYFNIECKGAILPLRVYFHDFDYIRNTHLPYLRDVKGWDKKVVAREAWLNAKRQELGLTEAKPLISIIISDSPEVISHYSSTLCLSRHEFPIWYSMTKELGRFVGFDEFQEEALQKRMAKLTDKSRDELEEYLGVRFGHETS
jgi:hypothetical protein